MTLIFIALLFPYEKIAQKILAKVDPAGRVLIDFETLNLALPIGLSARGVSLAIPPSLPTIFMDRVVLTPSWTIFKLEPGVSFRVRGFGGSLSGSYRWKGKKTGVKAKWASLDPTQLPLPALVARKIKGSLSGEAEVTVDTATSLSLDGFIQLHGEKIRLDNLDLFVVQIPSGELGRLDLQIGFDKSQAILREAFLQGRDLAARADGTVVLQAPLSSSPLHAEIFFKPMGDLVAKLTPLVSGKLRVDGEGYYRLALGGTLGFPIPEL